MGVALKEPMTLEAFLDWENRQGLKYEFDGFQPVAMVGVTTAHAAIQRNLLGLLFTGLRGHRCQAFGSDLSVRKAIRPRLVPRPRSRLLAAFAIPTGSSSAHQSRRMPR
jgi:hypothetical protein